MGYTNDHSSTRPSRNGVVLKFEHATTIGTGAVNHGEALAVVTGVRELCMRPRRSATTSGDVADIGERCKSNTGPSREHHYPLSYRRRPFTRQAVNRLTTQGRVLIKSCLAFSADEENEFRDVTNGPRVSDSKLTSEPKGPNSGGLWRVMERMGGASCGNRVDAAIGVKILTAERLGLDGPWGRRDR